MGGRDSRFVRREEPRGEGARESPRAEKLSVKQAVLEQMSARFSSIADGLESSITEEGRGAHRSLVYFVVDPTKDAEEPEARRQLSTGNCYGIREKDIKGTAGFEKLQNRCREMGVSFTLKEQWPEVMCDPRDGGYEDDFVWQISISG